jgi:hypothetical protein
MVAFSSDVRREVRVFGAKAETLKCRRASRPLEFTLQRAPLSSPFPVTIFQAEFFSRWGKGRVGMFGLRMRVFKISALAVFAAGLSGCASHSPTDGSVDPQAAVARASATNLQAVAAHQTRMRVVDSAMSLGAVVPQIAGPVGSRIQQKAHEASQEKMIEDSLRDLSPEQRALMKKHMRGEISEEEFRLQLFAPYGLDAEGNPVKTEP